jgi:ribosomal-protein-alanine N-acetyltransferase
MIRRDMPFVLPIADTAPDRWTENNFLDALRERNTIGMVAEAGDDLVGHVVYSPHKTKLEVLTLAVRPDRRRQGVGTQLLDKLKGKLAGHRRTRLGLTVPETSLDAQLFLRAQDFVATRLLPGHFEDEDGIRFAYRLPAGAEDLW